MTDHTEHAEPADLPYPDLQASLAHYYSLYDLAPVGYCTLDSDQFILESNQAAANLLGVGRRPLLAQSFSHFVLAEDRQLYQTAHRALQESGGVQECRLRLVNHGGAVSSPFWVQLNLALVEEKGRVLSLLVFCDINSQKQNEAAVASLADRDIILHKQVEEAFLLSERQRLDEQRAANDQLREQNERLESIYQSLDSVGLVILNLGGLEVRVESCNSGAERLLGYRTGELVGQSILTIHPEENRQPFRNQIEALRLGRALVAADISLRRKNGEAFPAVVSVHPYGWTEGVCRTAVAVFQDVSELIRTHKELEVVNKELELRVEQRTCELQETQQKFLHSEKLSAIGQLSASIAHEFNNSMQGIMAVLRGLEKRAVLMAEDRELLMAAVKECDRVKDLIRNLQDFNRPSSGRKELVDLHRSLNAILLFQKSDFKVRRITLVTRFADHLPAIEMVPDQLKQVILNLLSNAADACQQPGGVVTVSTRREGDRVAFTIEDTGVGIEAEAIPRLFEPFYTTKPAVKGTGLGLSVSYGIVKEHGGEIMVASEPGNGTTFTVLLPITASLNSAGAGQPTAD